MAEEFSERSTFDGLGRVVARVSEQVASTMRDLAALDQRVVKNERRLEQVITLAENVRHLEQSIQKLEDNTERRYTGLADKIEDLAQNVSVERRGEWQVFATFLGIIVTAGIGLATLVTAWVRVH